MPKYRTNSDNPARLDVIVNGDVEVGFLSQIEASPCWTFTPNMSYLFATELEDIAKKLKELENA